MSPASISDLSLVFQLQHRSPRLIRQLSLNPREPVLCGLVPGRTGDFFETSKRKGPGRDEIACAMLVVDGERLDGLTRDVSRTPAQLDQLAPVAGRLIELSA